METIGDCYVAACGLFSVDEEGKERLGGYRPNHAQVCLCADVRMSIALHVAPQSMVFIASYLSHCCRRVQACCALQLASKQLLHQCRTFPT